MNGNNLNYFGHECSFKSYGYLIRIIIKANNLVSHEFK